MSLGGTRIVFKNAFALALMDDLIKTDALQKGYRVQIEYATLIAHAGVKFAKPVGCEKFYREAFKEASVRLEKIARRVPGCVYQMRVDENGKFSFPYASDGIHAICGQASWGSVRTLRFTYRL